MQGIELPKKTHQNVVLHEFLLAAAQGSCGHDAPNQQKL